MCNDIILKVSNLIAFILLTAVKGFTTFNNKVANNDFLLETYNSTTTFTNVYLLPKQYTFGIWGLIYILLAGFVLYQQWTEKANNVTIHGVSYHFCIAATLNIIWLILIWFIQENEKLFIIIDTLVITTLFVFLYFIYDNLEEHYPPETLTDRIFVHAPFKIYFAWTFITLIINFWIAIPTLNTIIISSITLVYLGFMGLYYVDYRKKADLFITATIAWALVGIAIKHYEILPILAASSFSIGMILGGVLRYNYDIYIIYNEKGF
ncbi:uncharacterized protein OCT59_017006 [Rhizophagus irregularis]|uniref:Uncharacterized protein n=2 Tax=Rhizophagus irregularis TaxID=588596 RepID=U9UBG1_RHIID|nr:hypothetical protein GLOIN_2v1478215 [Rhizophagus irregularis DAOM 181602=DAOM 197198]EXX69468.1 hypothetical protein RirG_095780 [Rhizophagus irregularis DAOM 197198w]POG71739.1 hypothetical protein GLOIN_2v1478215 [Rhizophagus irregularis DAOM 181602=DAOM 197198]UZO24711.1 hypothetical protein OCT59_017006 [Rhizophagus irregularis]GBC14626.1 tryptophan-rich sensory protein [Rhizophagus irregularis DAOM 181602=DAOM 197198]|eukprot:XP_025178605.1 hypothetical protein GLOIN_2v1478215 [Rhizophagus irregularis DAOM 181602=DAOM 197198]